VTASEPRSTDVLPARVTMPLLVRITQQSMDEDYEHVAEQRRSGVRPVDARSGRSPRTMVAVLLFGALLAVAAVQTARNADVNSAGREQLISRIDARRTSLADLQDQKARLTTDNAAASASLDAAGRRLNDLDGTRADLLVPTGFDTMTGPGVRIVVDDATDGGELGKVQDEDLALLVNGLWQAGARGVAVNGQRVTALSSLRNTAQAIRINGVSLSPPYTVLAVGDNRTLQADLAESSSGTEFTALTDQYGMSVSMENRDSVRLPAASAGMMSLRYARSGSSQDQKPKGNQEDTQ
jgi:uncharacterized protein YlxW (UPF0749 family)